MQLLGRWKVLPLDVEAVQIGPATTHLYYNSIMGEGVMIQYILPVEPMVQKLVHVFYTERTWLPPYAKLVLLGESIHVERDIRVWNNKRFCSSPVLVKEDSPILKFRRWYSQFYSEETLDDSPRSLDWWNKDKREKYIIFLYSEKVFFIEATRSSLKQSCFFALNKHNSRRGKTDFYILL